MITSESDYLLTPFENDNTIYDIDLIVVYCRIFMPPYWKIFIDSDLVYNNLYEIEWFNAFGRHDISVMNVLDNPKKYLDHYRRILDVNVGYPIVIWKEKIWLSMVIIGWIMSI